MSLTLIVIITLIILALAVAFLALAVLNLARKFDVQVYTYIRFPKTSSDVSVVDAVARHAAAPTGSLRMPWGI